MVTGPGRWGQPGLGTGWTSPRGQLALQSATSKARASACCVSRVMRVSIWKICFKKLRMGPGRVGQWLPVGPKWNCLLSKSDCSSKAQMDFIALVPLQGSEMLVLSTYLQGDREGELCDTYLQR